MPAPMFIDSLDDEVAFEANNNFSGGQVSNARAMLLADNQAAELINIDLALSGEAPTRRGTAALGGIVGGSNNTAGIQGMFWYSTSTDEYLVAANKHKLYKWTGGAWNQIGGATWTSTDDNAMTHFAQLSSKLYFCNGTCNLFSWDGTTMVDLGNAANNQPPANAKLVVEHTNRLVVCGSGVNRNTLYFSQFLDGTLFDKTLWSLQVGDHNDEIVALKSWSDFNLLVFKRHGVYAINCDPSLQLQDPNNSITYFEIKPIHQQLGCVASESVQQIGNDVYFLSSHGVYSINKIIASGSTQEIGPDLSYAIHDYIERINIANASKCAAVGYGNKYMLSFPLDSSTYPNAIMVWNDSLSCWTGIWVGLAVTCFAYCSPVTGNLLRMGTATEGGLVKEWLDYVSSSSETTSTFQDSGTDIGSIVTTRAYTFGGITNKKTGRAVRADFYNSLASCTLAMQLDSQDPVVLKTIPSSGGIGIVFPFAFPRMFPAIGTFKDGAALQGEGQFTQIQFQISSTAGKLNMLSLAVSAWLDTLDEPM